MNNYQIAAYVVSNALRAANEAQGSPLDAEILIQLSGAVSSTVSVHGADHHKAILKAAYRITPDFEFIAEDFFLILDETPVIASAARSKDYAQIAEFIIANPELTPEERLQLYGETYPSKTVKFWKGFRIVCLSLTLIAVLLQLGLILFQPECREKFLNDWKKMKQHFANVRKHAGTLRKAVRFLSSQKEK